MLVNVIEIIPSRESYVESHKQKLTHLSSREVKGVKKVLRERDRTFAERRISREEIKTH